MTAGAGRCEHRPPSFSGGDEMPAEMLSEAFPLALSPPFLFVAGLIGSLIGSFLNVCIYRLPRGLSVVLPPSACPHCGGPIPWYLNVPIFSWLMLRGRAACCGEPIPARYLLVEAATALSAVAIMARDGATLEGFARFAFLAALIVLFFTDLDLRLLPDAVTLTGAAAGLLLSFARPWLGAPLAWSSAFRGCLSPCSSAPCSARSSGSGSRPAMRGGGSRPWRTAGRGSPAPRSLGRSSSVG
ncbi:MAG: hypothetical protein DMF49_10100 [Acidobacteria bacterium]|nr:MAG: hypothetical protein DMF49_10100 [Acidobacteriota bacterium]